MSKPRAGLAVTGRLRAIDSRPAACNHEVSDTVLARILVCWTLFDASGKPLRCELCRTSTGLQIRCVQGNEVAVRKEPVDTAAQGLATAALWRGIYVVEDGFLEKSVTVADPPVEHRRAVRRA
jgi:hypothetical protein